MQSTSVNMFYALPQFDKNAMIFWGELSPFRKLKNIPDFEHNSSMTFNPDTENPDARW